MPVIKKSEIHLRATISSYCIFIAIWGVPFALWVISSLVNRRIEWYGLLVCLLGLLGFVLWLATFKLTLIHNTLIYRSLFGGTVSLPLHEICKVDIIIGCYTYADRFKPTSRLIIEPRQSSMKNPIVINIKPFGSKDVKDFLFLLDRVRESEVNVTG